MYYCLLIQILTMKLKEEIIIIVVDVVYDKNCIVGFVFQPVNTLAVVAVGVSYTNH